MDAKSNVSPASNQDTDVQKQAGANKRKQKQQAKTSEQAHVKASSDEDYDMSSSREEDNSEPSSQLHGQNLTKKKLEYLQQKICDKNGTFTYEQDPERYKKARKRLQNRESAVRSRQKKREEVEELESIVRALQEQKAAVESENQALKRQNEYFQNLFAKQQQCQPGVTTASSGSHVTASVETPKEVSVTSVKFESDSYSRQDELLDDVQPLDMTCGNFLKRQKTDGNDFMDLSGTTPSRRVDTLRRQDSFFSDAPNYNLIQRHDSVELGSEQLNSGDMLMKEDELRRGQQPGLVLQRNNESIGNFLVGGNGLLGLTVVCAALGVVTSKMGSTETHSNSFSSSQDFRQLSSDARCKQYGDCADALQEAINRLFYTVYLMLASFPPISLVLGVLTLVLFVKWLKPIKMMKQLLRQSSAKEHKHSSSRSSRKHHRRSSSSGSITSHTSAQ